MLSLVLAATLSLAPEAAVRVAVLPADPASFDMPPEFGPRAADKAVLAGAQEVCVQPNGQPRRRAASPSCDEVRGRRWGFGEANTSIDICEHEDVATMTSARVTCTPEDVTVKTIDMSNVDCASDPCFADVAKKAGATHMLRIVGFFRDTFSMAPTLSVTATVTRLSDGATHLVRSHDVDPEFDATRPRPAYQAMGIMRWLARSAVAREVTPDLVLHHVPTEAKDAERMPASPAAPVASGEVKPSVLAPAIVTGAGVLFLAAGVVLWTGAGDRGCGSVHCETDRSSASVGIPLTIGGGLLALGGGAWLFQRLAVSNSVAFSGRF